MYHSLYFGDSLLALKRTQKNIKFGDSRVLTIPSQLVIGERSSVAANRLFLADVRGEISEDDLLEFLETHIEPAFWKWIEEKKKEATKK